MYGPQGGMPMMGGAQQMQMMQSMMAQRQAHMQQIEARMATVESQLQQLLELQKAK